MWSQFFLALLVLFVLLYVPGFLVARSLTSDTVVALVAAPLVSSCAYSLLSVVCGEAGIHTTWVTLVAPTMLVGVACVVSRFLRREASPQAGERSLALVRELTVYLPYVLFGMAVCLVYFVKPLDGPESFTWRTDMCNHLNLIARFVNTGNWSMLHASIYEDASKAAILGSSYYPAGWHVLACLLASCLGVSAPLAANAVNAVVIAVTIPTSSYLLVRCALSDKPLAMRLGAIFPLAFGCFPWRLLIPPGLAPFMLGLTFAIAVVALSVDACEGFCDLRGSVGPGTLVVLGYFACAFVHPSCMFTAVVLLVPYACWLIWRLSVRRFATHARLRAALCVCGFVALVLAAWALCYRIPLIHNMCAYVNTAFTRKANALLQVVFMGFKAVPIQPVLALFVWTGVAYSLYRTRYLWMSCAFCIFSAFYCFSATSDAPLKNFVTGLWYSNVIRLAACACVMAVPLAALGLYAAVRVAQRVFEQLSDSRDKAAQRFGHLLIPALFVGVSALVIFYPSFTLPHFKSKTVTAFGYVSQRARRYNKADNNILSPDEHEFLDKVKKIVGDDPVINFVFDGSSYAYATHDVNVFTRRFNSATYSSDARYLNAHLTEVATDGHALELLRTYGIRYALLLDMDEQAELATIYEDPYIPSIWKGLVELDDDTPGFEVVLSEGDMRLYRIVGV